MTSVNSPAGVDGRFDARAKDIVHRAVNSADGVLVGDLVRQHVLAGRPKAVVRASLSRTLRRLWRVGLVELHDSRFGQSGHTLGAKHREARERLARLEANPEAGYQEYRAWVTAARLRDVYGSAEALLAAKRVRANAVLKLRAVRVTATPLGRELLGGLGKSADVRRHKISAVRGNHERRADIE